MRLGRPGGGRAGAAEAASAPLQAAVDCAQRCRRRAPAHPPLGPRRWRWAVWLLVIVSRCETDTSCGHYSDRHASDASAIAANIAEGFMDIGLGPRPIGTPPVSSSTEIERLAGRPCLAYVCVC